MPSVSWILIRALIAAVFIYVLFAGGLYFFQEKLLVHPRPLPADYRFEFSFNSDFEERHFKTDSGAELVGLHFRTPNPKGVVFGSWGNGENAQGAGYAAPFFLERGYDFLVVDYPGFGKSQGEFSEQALFDNAQFIYDELKKEYAEQDIVVVGASFGTGIAAYLAGHNTPKLALLLSPYFSMQDLAHTYYPFIPTGLLLRFPLRSDRYLNQATAPIYLVHGTDDSVIYYGSSMKLSMLLGTKSSLLTLEGVGHIGLLEHPAFGDLLKQILP